MRVIEEEFTLWKPFRAWHGFTTKTFILRERKTVPFTKKSHALVYRGQRWPLPMWPEFIASVGMSKIKCVFLPLHICELWDWWHHALEVDCELMTSCFWGGLWDWWHHAFEVNCKLMTSCFWSGLWDWWHHTLVVICGTDDIMLSRWIVGLTSSTPSCWASKMISKMNSN